MCIERNHLHNKQVSANDWGYSGNLTYFIMSLSYSYEIIIGVKMKNVDLGLPLAPPSPSILSLSEAGQIFSTEAPMKPAKSTP